MNLLNGTKFELPQIFSTLTTKWGHPPKAASRETRVAADVVTRPYVSFYNPDDLHFPNAMRPVVPGGGGYVSMGIGMVQYDHQPQWDRSNVAAAGPVREFFASVLFDTRTKHV